jgi:hypothetical protein
MLLLEVSIAGEDQASKEAMTACPSDWPSALQETGDGLLGTVQEKWHEAALWEGAESWEEKKERPAAGRGKMRGICFYS